MCLRTVTKTFKRGTTKPQKWYKIVYKNPYYEGNNMDVYFTSVRNTPIIMGDSYHHTKKRRSFIIYGQQKMNPEYAKARADYRTAYDEWLKKYRTTGNRIERAKMLKEKPAFVTPKGKDGKYISQFMKREEYPTGFHFYSYGAAVKGVDSINRPWDKRDMTNRKQYFVLECEVTGIHTIGQDHHGEACVAYSYTPIKIIK